jgi:hypothetical protein
MDSYVRGSKGNPSTASEDGAGDRRDVWEARRSYMWPTDNLTFWSSQNNQSTLPLDGGKCGGVGPLRNGRRDCIDSKSRKYKSTGHSKWFCSTDRKSRMMVIKLD